MPVPRVLIFTETFYPVMGGGETQARLLAEGLLAQGFSVRVLTRRSDASLAKEERVGETVVHRILPMGGGQFKKWGLAFFAFPALVRLRGHYDAVYVSGFRIIGMTAVLACKVLGKGIVLKADSQGEMSGEFFESGLARFGLTQRALPFRAFLRLRNVVLKRADAFVAITDAIAKELSEAGVRPEKVHRIPNAVDTERFASIQATQRPNLRRKLGLPVSARIVTYAGRLVSYKGLPLLLSVWTDIRRTHRQATLVLVGAGGLDIHNCEKGLKEFVRENRLEDSVVFTGSVENVAEFLQASDIFVFPTENDAFPSALVEAMACRLPVVATPVGAIPTFVEHEHNGLMVRPGNFEDLLEALKRLLTDSDLADRLGSAAWQTVKDRYSAEQVTRRLGQLLSTHQERSISGIENRARGTQGRNPR